MAETKKEILDKIKFEMNVFKEAFPYSHSRISELLIKLEALDHPTKLPDISAEDMEEDMEIWRSAQKYK